MPGPARQRAGMFVRAAAGRRTCANFGVALSARAMPSRAAGERPYLEPVLDAARPVDYFSARCIERALRLFSEIHEVAVSGGAETLVTPTSQFAAFSPNGDGSVFVGASRSKAQPDVMLLLRSGHSEMTLCEHQASQAGSSVPGVLARCAASLFPKRSSGQARDLFR